VPNRNVAKVSTIDTYYDVNIHKSDGQFIYSDEVDYQFFLSLLEKYLSEDNSVELLVYCLEPNHFDLLLCQINSGSVSKLMHNIVIGYNDYFYEKYGVEDLLSENEYKVSKVSSGDLLDMSCHIHCEPDEWIEYPHSSLRAYFYDDVPSWLNKTYIAKLYGSAVKYLEFMEDCQKARNDSII
jgi:hypothetical protein